MANYSDGFKLMIVNEYLEARLGYKLLAKKHGMPDFKPIRRWVKAYQVFGKAGLLRKRHSSSR